jgi:hypothetical protein
MTDPQTRPTLGAVHAPSSIALATLLGSPLAGALLLLRNDAPLGQRGRHRVLVIPAAVVGVGLAFGFLRAPQSVVLWGGLSVVMAALFSVLAWNHQGSAFRRHVAGGGVVTSPGVAMVVGLVCQAMLLAGTHFLGSPALQDSGGRVDFGDKQFVYFSQGGTEEEARDVGNFLKRTPYPGDAAPFFSGDHPADARVTHDGERVVLSFVVSEGVWKNDATQRGYHAFGTTLGQQLFVERPLRVDLTDAHWVAHRKLVVR